MKCNRIVFLPVVVAVVMIFLAGSVPVPADVGKGDTAPNFTLDNVTGAARVTLSNFTNRPTLLVFWVSWCSHCQREVPTVDKVYKQLRSKGMNAVGVSVDDTVGAAQGFVKNYSVSFPNAYAGTDDGQAMLQVYGVQGVPTIYVLDRGGVVRARFIGETDAATIKNEFAKLGVK